MSYRRGYYKKDGTYVQGHFVQSKSKIKKSKGKGCLISSFFILLLVFIHSCSDETNCESKKCSEFTTQPEAQAVFNTDPNCYRNLDTDSDNIPCENLPTKIQ